MKAWLKNIKSRSNLDFNTLSLIVSIGFMLLAIINPSIPLKHNIYNYIFVTDISQSMNTVDMSIMNKPISRLEYMKHSLHEIMSELPCGTKVSIGMFVGVSVAASYTPLKSVKILMLLKTQSTTWIGVRVGLVIHVFENLFLT